MILTQLDILQPKRSWQTLLKQLETNQKLAAKAIAKSRRNMIASLRSQYMVHKAISDTRRAISLNEDIVLATLIIIAVLSFSTVSILANTLYTFMLTATFISELFNTSMIALSVIALGVLSISLMWLIAWMQNMITIALMEAVTRKRYRSLRTTLRKSLRSAPQTATAWVAVIGTTFIPAMVILLTSLLVTYFGQFAMEDALPYIAGAAVVSTAWAVYALANFSLLPYVMLFNKTSGLRDGLRASRQLVKRKGKIFIMSNYVLVGLLLTGAYFGAAAIESATGINRNLPFLTVTIFPLVLGNCLLTMLYRKRKLARY